MQSDTTSRALAIFACALGTALVAPESLHAQCASPTPTLFWSFPAAGATDVPTDATFWFVAPSNMMLTLDDKPLAERVPVSSNSHTVDSGTLQPDTAYVLHVQLSAWGDTPADSASPVSVDIPFHTGNVTATRPAAPTVIRRDVSTEISIRQRCKEIIRAQTCADWGPYSLVEFEVAPDPEVVGWVVQGSGTTMSTVWPSSCGTPAVYVRSYEADGCFTLSAIGAGGTLSPVTRHCGAASASPASGTGGAPAVASTTSSQGSATRSPPVCSVSHVGAAGTGAASGALFVLLAALLRVCTPMTTKRTRCRARGAASRRAARPGAPAHRVPALNENAAIASSRAR
jgi:hypothetical protein